MVIVACTELLMVVHDAMGDDMGVCLDEAEEIIGRIVANEREHLKRFRQYGWVFNSCHFKVEPEGRFVPKSLMKALPLLPAVNAYTFLYTRHVDALKPSDPSPAVLATAHLYQGWKIIGAIQQPWTDMEFFVAPQNARRSFARLSDTSIRSVVDSFGLALGISLKTVLSNNEPRLPTPDQVNTSATKCMPLCRFSTPKMKLHSKDPGHNR
ncbi:hypothetical protein AC579_10519 [Pseudocercospora musae]|uniref:Uncharacterized protein n=1 Tax=Pseudocercospora musae TaxID=113226 RepID=A0A139IH42_9PEZI|nr:hypothetical protein AC579_10519 [Pseudocercospora musae]